MSSVAVNKHQLKTEQTKRRLLKAAERIFVRDGFEAARIEEIAAEAGYTRGAFYAHFRAKEDLFFALVEQQANLHLEVLRKLLEECSDDEQRKLTLRNYYAQKAGNRQWAVLVFEFKLHAVRHGKLRAKLAQSYRRIKSKIHLEGIAQLGTDVGLADWRRVVLEVILRGLVLERVYDPTSLSEEQIGSVLGKIFDLVIDAPDL